MSSSYQTQIARFVRVLLAMLALCLSACNSAAPERNTPGAAPPVEPPPAPAPVTPSAPVSGGGMCSLSGTSQPCTCGSAGAGHRTCIDGAWAPCVCVPGQATGMQTGSPPGSQGATAGSGGAMAVGEGEPAAAVMPPSAQPEPPTGVVFDWPETAPGTATPCEPGRYVGMFSCDLYIIAMDGRPAFELSGTVDMTLEQSMDGEILRIADGQFVSAAAVAIPAWGDIVGELECSSGRFDGRLENGRFSVALGLPIPFTEGTFEGDLSADYDADAGTLHDGLWDMVGQLDGFPGSCQNGTWSAMRVE